MKCSRRNVRSWFVVVSSAALALSMSACKTKPKAGNIGVLGSRDLVPPPYARPIAADTSRQSFQPGAAQEFSSSAGGQSSAEPSLPAAESFVPAESPVYVPAESMPQPEDVLSTPPAAPSRVTSAAPSAISTPVTPPPTEKLRQYQIQEGDTMSGIAQVVGVKWQDIAALNPSVDPKRMKIGETLYLPSHALDKPIVVSKRDKASGKTSSSAVKSSSIPSDGVYIVVSGDSLWTISRRFKVSSDDIRSWNNLKTDKLMIGQKLKLKGTAVVKDAAPQKTVKPSVVPAVPAELPEPVAPVATDLLVEETAINTTDTIPTEAIKARAIDHLISENDTLESIAMLYEVKLEDLLRSNPNIKSNADLVPNTIIKIAYPTN